MVQIHHLYIGISNHREVISCNCLNLNKEQQIIFNKKCCVRKQFNNLLFLMCRQDQAKISFTKSRSCLEEQDQATISFTTSRSCLEQQDQATFSFTTSRSCLEEQDQATFSFTTSRSCLEEQDQATISFTTSRSCLIGQEQAINSYFHNLLYLSDKQANICFTNKLPLPG